MKSSGTELNNLPERRALSVLLLVAVSLGLLCIGFIRVFDPEMNTREFLIGVCMIAAGAAVTVNASVLGAMTPTAAQSERAVRRRQHES